MLKHCNSRGGRWLLAGSQGVHDAGEAEDLLLEALRLDKHNGPAWTQLCVLRARESRLRGTAKETFQQALEACPGNKHILLVFSEFLSVGGYPRHSEEILRRLADEHPHNGRILRSLGLLELGNGNTVEAAQLFRRGAKADDVVGRLLCAEELARLSATEGRPEVARQVRSTRARGNSGSMGPPLLCAL